MYIETENRYKPGTKIIIECSLPHNALPVKAYCDVRWTNDRAPGPLGIGVKFIGIYESGLNKINIFIEKSLKKVDSDTLSLADFIEVNDADIFKKTELFWEFIEDTNLKDFNKYGTPLKSASRNRALIRDKKTGREREVIMMGTSNYLGLTTHPKVLKAAKRALDEHGTGTASVRLLSGTHEMHQELERKLAELKDTEDAAVFPTGHMANMGCITSLLGKKDIAIIDKNVHASILDGCGLSLGTFRTFRHSDTEHLRILLKRAHEMYFGKLIIVEGVDGIDGDLTPLPEICELAEEFGAKVLVDEAHATGVIGERGKGTASYYNLENRVDVFMDSLSKSFGGLGGYVASTREIIRYIKYYARTSFFSVSAPIPFSVDQIQEAVAKVLGAEVMSS